MIKRHAKQDAISLIHRKDSLLADTSNHARIFRSEKTAHPLVAFSAEACGSLKIRHN
jgi:hypothetical protein